MIEAENAPEPTLTDYGRAVELLRQRKAAYQLTFGGPHGEDVLKDLLPFCRGVTTCFHPDARIHAALEGRREVWLRIRNHLDRTPEELVEIYAPDLVNGDRT
jgi:hypothetical protein